MAGLALTLAHVNGLTRRRISRRLLVQTRRAKHLDESHHLPHFFISNAHRRHLSSGYAIADAGIERHIRAAMAVLPKREIGPTAALALGAVTVRAVGLKQPVTLFDPLRIVECIGLDRGSFGGI